MSIALILLGLGLWKLKEWGRKGSIAYAVLSVFCTVGSSVYNTIYVIPQSLAITSQTLNQTGSKDVLQMISLATVVGVACVTLVINIIIAVYLTRPSVKYAFGHPPIA